jgi:hypothetical protein
MLLPNAEGSMTYPSCVSLMIQVDMVTIAKRPTPRGFVKALLTDQGARSGQTFIGIRDARL